ncbi:INO80 complex subunit D isoform X2 [Copidosoma floridanum]|uniref:INO80 complex subunit D isoform X2 n=1 Tax=Copidosoma floridanum TaxID=29053 RepID=UPI000C6F679E|nr:INO80 complex subunit D isoform X2 [Copidosoma floridanum]
MKILNSKHPTMDNKLKFSDRFKVFVNSDLQKGVDPYVFNDTEQPLVVSTGGKNIKLIAPKNSKTPSTNRNKSRGKVLKTKIKTESNLLTEIKTEPRSDSSCNMTKSHYAPTQLILQKKEKYIKLLQKYKEKRIDRDHTLQYYPRAGEELSDSESSSDELLTYQHHWYSGTTDFSSTRSSRLANVRVQLQRQLYQLQFKDEEQQQALKKKTRYLLQAALRDPTATARILSGSKSTVIDGPLIVGSPCGAEGCQQTSLPCTRHCSRHIMLNSDQLLFEHCTAKFSDNTQCSVPVFDVAHELPLCPEHARKRDNYHRKSQESKPKKARSKKPSSPNPAKPSKSRSRPKKRKRPPSTGKLEVKTIPHQPIAEQIVPPVMPSVVPTNHHHLLPDENHFTNHMISNNELTSKTLNNLNTLAQEFMNNLNNLNNLGLDVGSLGLGAGLKVELDDHEVFASLDHATEHDFENVLNSLPADAFNDLFTEGRNGEYEPSREEEEELERAVEAFDKDVRNIERMGGTHGLLEPSLLVQLMSDIAS